MKKISFFSLLLAAGLHTNAQANFGFTGGASLAKTSASGSGSHLGVFAGAVMDLKFGKAGSFRPELLYMMKGEKPGNDKGSYNYLELPLNFLYNMPSKIGRFSFGGGPAFSYMLSGSWTAQGQSKEKIYFGYDHVNQFDYGLNLLAGLQVKGGIFFTANYTLGFANVWQAATIGANKNRTIGIAMGVML